MNITQFLFRLRALSLALFLLPGTAAHATQGQDMLVGNGTSGPFSLSWKAIERATETVQVNQQAQMRGLDYTLDADAGTITFTRPLPAQSAASVSYQYDPAHASRANAPSRVPLSFDLARTEKGRVSFDAVYQANGSGRDAAPGLLTLGLGSGWQGAHSQVDARVLFAPTAANGAPGKSIGGASRLGFAVDGGADAGRGLHLTFGYGRAGEGLTGADNDTLTAGMQTMTAGAALAPTSRVRATVDYTQAQSVTGDMNSGSSRAAASLSVSPLDTVQVQTHWAQTAHGQDAPTQTADVSVHAAPNAAASLDASFTTTHASEPADNAQAINLAATLAPAQSIALTAAATQAQGSGGVVSTQNVTLALSPGKAFHLSTGMSLRQTLTAQTAMASVEGQFQPVSFLEFSGSYRNRTAAGADARMADTLDTGAARVTLSPLRGLQLTGTYDQNPDNGGDAPRRVAQRGVGVETSLGALSLSGGCDWQRPYDALSTGTILRVGLGLRLSRATHLDGSYKQSLSGTGDAASQTGTSLAAFGLTHTLGDRFHLTVGGTMQKPIGAAALSAPDYAANASLGMKF